MKAGRLSVRIDALLLQQVRQFAEQQGVSVSFLVDQFFRQLVEQHSPTRVEEEAGVEQA